MNLKLNKYIKYDSYYELIIGHKDIFISTFIDIEDYPLVNKHHWRMAKKRNKFYVCYGCQSKGIKTVYLTQLLLGKAKEGYEIDHIDGDSLNNRKYNLRVIPQDVNKRLVKVKSNNVTSGIRGVSYSTLYNTWKCDFTYKQIRLGGFTFAKIDDAVYLRYLFESHFGLNIICRNNIAMDILLKNTYNKTKVEKVFNQRLIDKGVSV